MFSRFQKDLLEAMGFVLYVPVPAVAVTDVQAADDGFWQSPLGRNIARCAAGVDTARLAVPADMRGREAKKALWSRLKALRTAG